MMSTEYMNSDSQLYNSLELAKTFQPWVVRGKRREASKHYFIEEHKSVLSRNLTAQLCLYFYLYYGLKNWILELQYYIKFDASECNENVCEFWSFQPDQTKSFLIKSMASKEKY